MPQTATNTIRLAPPTDDRVVQLFSTLAERFPGADFDVRAGDAPLGNFRTAEAAQRRVTFDLKTSMVITAATYNVPNANIIVQFRRSIFSPGTSGPVQTASAYQNELSAYAPQNQSPSADIYLVVWLLLQAFAKEFQPRIGEARGTEDSWSEVLGAHVAQLASHQLQLVEGAEQVRVKAEAERQALLTKANEEAQRRRDAVEAEIRAAQGELAKEREALEAKKAELDDSEHKFARRSMREQITKDLRVRLELPAVSPGVRSQRSNVIVLSLFGVLALALLTGWATFDLHAALVAGGKDHFAVLVAAIRVGLPAAAAVGLLAWLLGYQRQLAAEDARVERDLERYRYDLDRASWIIETALEIQAQEGRTIPPDWLTGVTRNLFAVSEARGEGTSALEALGSLLNFSGKLELGPAGSKLELSRGGLKRLAKSAAAEAGD